MGISKKLRLNDVIYERGRYCHGTLATGSIQFSRVRYCSACKRFSVSLSPPEGLAV